jgi:hypothetical protein
MVNRMGFLWYGRRNRDGGLAVSILFPAAAFAIVFAGCSSQENAQSVDPVVVADANAGGTAGGTTLAGSGGVTLQGGSGGVGGSGGATPDASTDGAGGSGGTPNTVDAAQPNTVGQRATNITKVVLAVNLADGSVGSVRRDETWTLDVATGALSYADTAGTNHQGTATAAQIQAIVGAISAAAWRAHDACFYCCTDGVPYSPKITVTDPTGDWILGVSDNPKCAPSSRAYVGAVIGCADYATLLAAFEAVIAGVATASCRVDW